MVLTMPRGGHRSDFYIGRHTRSVVVMVSGVVMPIVRVGLVNGLVRW